MVIRSNMVFSLFVHKTDALLMSSQNICFIGKIRKISVLLTKKHVLSAAYYNQDSL